MSDAHIKIIAEALEPAAAEPAVGSDKGFDLNQDPVDSLSKLKGGRLLLGPRGVQLTQRDGSTVRIEPDSIVIQMPDGKLVKFEALMSQFGNFDRL